MVRRRQQRERGLEARAVALELERDAKAREAVIEERARIARELHDVVGHAISVMLLQARGGRRMLASEPEETRRALDAIDHAGEQALAEMRRLLGVLRETDEEPRAGAAAEPGADRRARRPADRDRAAGGGDGRGRAVRAAAGDRRLRVPDRAGGAHQRAQARRPGPRARDRALRRRSDLELEVLDDGPGTGNGGGSGHGLAGLRERVAVYGGELDAGRRPDGGYALRARLPLGSAR